MIPLGALCFMPNPLLTLTGVACIAAIGFYHRAKRPKDSVPDAATGT
jgi:hypothetical protein